MKKRILAGLMVGTLCLSMFAACGNSSGNDTKAESDKIVVGGLAPLTGGASVYGIAVNQGVQLAFEEINAKGGVLGKKIEYVCLDEKNDTTEAINGYNKLMEKNIVALIGDVTSTPSVAVSQRAAKDKLPMITPTGTALQITTAGPSIFRTCFTDPYQGESMAKFVAEELKLKTVAILSDAGNDYSVGIAKAFKDTCEKLGITIVANETYGKDDVDFKAQLTKIQQAAPEAIMVPEYYEKDIQIIRQARSIGITVPFLGGDGWDGILMESVTGSANCKDADNVYFANHYSPKDTDEKIANFVKTYKEKFKMDSVSFAALGYDSAYLLVDAITKAGKTDKDAITKALTEIKFSGITGEITFDANRNPLKSVSIIKIENGDYTLFTKQAVK